MIVIANKMDLPESQENLKEFKKKVKCEIFEVSAAKNQGLQEVINRLADILDTIPNNPLYDESQIESHVLYKFKKEEPFTYRFAKKLKRMGIDDKLKELGAKENDQVRIVDFYFDYKD